MANLQLVALFAIIFCVGSTLGSHFRYGVVSATKNPSNPKQLTFTIQVAFRRSAFFDQSPGGQLSGAASITIGSTSYTVSPTITNIDAANDISYASQTIVYTASGAGTINANMNSCCRIGDLNNAGGDAWSVRAKVILTQDEINKVTPVNNTPTCSTLPIVNVPYGVVPYSYQLLGNDPEGGQLTYSMSSKAEMEAGASQFQPPGVSIGASNGIVTLNSQLNLGKYSTQQKITDNFGNTIAVDYIIQVVQGTKYCTGTCSTPTPNCGNNGQCQGVCQSDNTHTGYTTPSGPQCKDPLPEIFTVETASNPGASKSTNLPAPVNGGSVTVKSGETIVIPIVADDAVFWVASSPVIMTFAALPPRSSASAQTSCNSASACTCVGCNSQPQVVKLTYSPIDADIGPHTVCLSVTSLGVSLPYSQHCFTINVLASAVCGNGIIESGESCDGGACCSSTCGFASSSTVCRGSTGVCDVAESCTGSSSSCPSDSFASSFVVCRAANGICDVAESCTGSSGSCPSDSFATSSTVCRASISTCDPSETCSGSGASCPSDINGDFEQACSGFTLPLGSGVYSFLDFNAISFGDFNAYTGDVEGRLAVRNKINVGWGYSVGYETQKNKDNELPYSVVSGGDATFQSGDIYPNGHNVPYNSNGRTEDFFVGGNFVGAADLKARKTGTCSSSGCLNQYFDAAQQCYTSLSNSIAAQADNTNHVSIWSTLYVNCTDPSAKAYYMSLTQAEMWQYTSVSVSATCNNHARWYVNFRGTGDITFAGNQDLPVNPAGVVYNLIGSGRKINVQTRVSGSLLAPNGEVNQTGGVIVGRLVAGNVAMSLQVNKNQCYVAV